MDQVRDMVKNPSVAGIGGLVIGLFVGLIILGWWLWPVQWENAGPSDLRPESRVEYLRMAIDSYASTSDAVTAQQRWQELGDAAGETLAFIETNPAHLVPPSFQAMPNLHPSLPFPPTSAIISKNQ